MFLKLSSMTRKNSTVQIFSTIVFYIVISFVVVLLILGWILSNKSPFPYQTYVIQSGSMEPSIMTGDIIAVKQESEYKQNDVVTFSDSSERVITHRIIEIQQDEDSQYITQGDANQSPDPHPIQRDQIIGKVILVIPKLGFAVAFAQSKTGIAILIGVPVILIIYDELRKVFAEVKK